ncbi:site-specific DNA-methyltransferase [Candidatus Binatus sp.]|uniref:site-specific DNA-methyltransferase n=1 Tax=Candidatus Binatus sp. TaxID=2811406 RepID=UPI003BB06AEE
MAKGNARAAKPSCASPRVSIIYRSVDDLKLDPKNPRSHRPRQIRQIARSIVEFGFLVPILIDASGKVIAGHGRLLAARQLGWREVPTIELHHLSEAQARAYMIADNRLTEISEWDDALLATQLRELAALDLDFSLEITGFDAAEIDLRIEQSVLSEDDDERANQIPEPSGNPPVTKTGDIWILNEHRVLCASALERNSYSTLMGKDRAEMVFIDPPYNVAIDGNVSGLGATRHKEFAMASGEMSKEEFQQFLTKVFLLLAKYSTPLSLHFVFMDWRHTGEVVAAGDDVYNDLINCCVWVKDNAGMGSFYRSQHEFVFVFKSQKGSHRNNVQLGQYGRNRTNVWSYPCANSFSRSGDEGHLLSLHPTVKPAALVGDAIMDCTERGAIVLDSFLGSGTTIIAAERTGRRCYGLEIDARYVDTIVRRWQAFTRNVAIHSQTGRSFAEIEEEVTGRCDSATRKHRPSPLATIK